MMSGAIASMELEAVYTSTCCLACAVPYGNVHGEHQVIAEAWLPDVAEK